MSMLLGGAYAVSAGLIVYAIERGYIARHDAFKYIIGWAALGLVLALVAAVRKGEDK
jgi:hypothetical protein